MTTDSKRLDALVCQVENTTGDYDERHAALRALLAPVVADAERLAEALAEYKCGHPCKYGWCETRDSAHAALDAHRKEAGT